MNVNRLLSRLDKEIWDRVKWLLFLAVAMVVSVAVSGCRVNVHDDYDPDPWPVPVYEARIISDQTADGDIGYYPPDAYVVSSAAATGSVLVGYDADFGDEYRGFLTFPMRDYNGIPYSAAIESATLEIFINDVSDVSQRSVVPLIIDLISYQPPYLVASDYSRAVQPPLLSMPIDIYPSDEGYFVAFDVTALVVEAQSRSLYDVQFRLLLDEMAASGIVEIDDDAVARAPLLSITYY